VDDGLMEELHADTIRPSAHNAVTIRTIVDTLDHRARTDLKDVIYLAAVVTPVERMGDQGERHGPCYRSGPMQVRETVPLNPRLRRGGKQNHDYPASCASATPARSRRAVP
jgi:hypothetical protein